MSIARNLNYFKKGIKRCRGYLRRNRQNMKRKGLLFVSSLVLLLGGAVGASLGLSRDIRPVQAAGTSTYGVLGVIEGVGTSWTLGSPLDIDLDSDGENLVVKKNWSLSAGDKFKFVLNSASDWSSAKGSNQIKYGTARYYFATDGDSNINVLADGVYDFYVNNSGEIAINFAESSPAATYSYVVSYDSNYTNVNGYTPDTIWSGSLPSLSDIGSGVANNLKIQRDFSDTKKDYNFWAIYKIDDRYLGNFTKFQIKNGSNNSNEMTISGTQKVYFENEETSEDANVYSAVKWIYDLCCGRSDYSYTDENDVTDTYAHSICNLLVTGDASTFISQYNTIKETVNGAGVLDRTYFYSTLDENHVTAAKVVNVLDAHVKKGTPSGAQSLLPEAAQSNGALVAIIVSAASVLAVGSFFLLRRKHQN